MLVLTRKLGAKVYIGADIEITVVDIDRGKVRLGVTAPRDVPIFRDELLTTGDPRHPATQQAVAVAAATAALTTDYADGVG